MALWGKIVLTIGVICSLLIGALLIYVVTDPIIAIILWILFVIVTIVAIIMLYHEWTCADPEGCAPVIIILISIAFVIYTINFIIL